MDNNGIVDCRFSKLAGWAFVVFTVFLLLQYAVGMLRALLLPEIVLHPVTWFTGPIYYGGFGAWGIWAARRWSRRSDHIVGTGLLLVYGGACLMGYVIVAGINEDLWWFRQSDAATLLVFSNSVVLVVIATVHIAAYGMVRKKQGAEKGSGVIN